MTSSLDPKVRDRVWDQLRPVALPDSRFHFDFARMHPDFLGSADAAGRLLAAITPTPAIAFSAPDGALTNSRELLLSRGVRVVVSTYCMRRGFRLLDPGRIEARDFAFAATLDGLERFGTPLSVADMAALGRIDLALSGAAAVAPNGVRFGRSYLYFDIEWGLMAELGLVGERTPVAVVVHDVQVAGDRVAAMPHEAVPDFIATPTRLLRLPDRPRRPVGVNWQGIDADEIELMPALVDLQRARGQRG